MEAVVLENFRCFREYREVPLAPLTFLVGENSTGKSSFLAAVKIAQDITGLRRSLDFNEPPFNLGAFDEIANYPGGRAGRAHDFLIGRHFFTRHFGLVKVSAKFEEINYQPAIQNIQVKSEDLALILRRNHSGSDVEVELQNFLKKSKKWKNFKNRITYHESASLTFDMLEYPLYTLPKGKLPSLTNKLIKSYIDFFNEVRFGSSFPYTIAPIRTRPERVYLRKQETRFPEGAHIPMFLARTYSLGKEKWDRLQAQLSRFGQACGLFKEITVKLLGRPSGPFQLQVKIAGRSKNLIDVGYGVSQVLPVLVDSFEKKQNNIFLIQQPEVHLHPKAQAELGSLFLMLAGKMNNRFVVETHSDHIVNRVRLDVKENKSIDSKDVLILFFERQGPDVRIFPITIDKQGNLLGCPPTFREFFLEEERRLWLD